MRPKCFYTDKQWQEWVAAARILPPHPKSGYCEDCLPSYQRKMILADLCEYPNTKFVFTEDEIVGRRNG